MNWKKWIVAVSLIVACAIAIIWGLYSRNSLHSEQGLFRIMLYPKQNGGQK